MSDRPVGNRVADPRGELEPLAVAGVEEQLGPLPVPPDPPAARAHPPDEPPPVRRPELGEEPHQLPPVVEGVVMQQSGFHGSDTHTREATPPDTTAFNLYASSTVGGSNFTHAEPFQYRIAPVKVGAGGRTMN